MITSPMTKIGVNIIGSLYSRTLFASSFIIKLSLLIKYEPIYSTSNRLKSVLIIFDNFCHYFCFIQECENCI